MSMVYIMKSNSDYAEIYKSRTEDVKQVLRKDDQSTVDYKLYNEAVIRAVDDKSSNILIRWFYELLACIFIILVPSIVIGQYIGYHNAGKFVMAGGCLLFLAVIGIRGLLLGAVINLEDHLIIGNPYGKGKIPATKNIYLRKWLNRYKRETETIFLEMKRDEEKSLDAIAYNQATWDSIGDIDTLTPLKKIIGLIVALVSVMMLYQFVLPSGEIKEIIEVVTFLSVAIVGFIYFVERYPLRSEIKRLIRLDNPYKTG